jgi:ligand-binding SRPBCC domain-containing protein
MRWRTLIEEMRENTQFVDTQLKGPYKKWHHTHSFIELGGGTLLRDRVLYQVPAGRLGSTLLGAKIRKDVSQIFEYRRKKIVELFS